MLTGITMSKTKVKTSCVKMTGPDDRMDHVGDRRLDANPLPAKCPHCSLPDLCFTAKPYLLARGFASPAETAPARMGNFLVRERVKKILELAVPDACMFIPTAEFKSKKATEWWLAVPNTWLKTAMPKAKAPFCSKCREPKVRGPLMGAVWDAMKGFDSAGVDIFKAEEWYARTTIEDDLEETNRHRKKSNLPPLAWSYRDVEPPVHAERWTRRDPDRDLYFSLRLEQLLKRAKVKGQLVRLLDFQDLKPSATDEVWIEEKLQLLAKHGLVDAPKPAAKTASAAQKWFQQFLKKNAAKKSKAVDLAAIEKKQKLVLPADYKEFIATIGTKTFADVNDMEGSTTTVLPPAELDFKNCRRGKVPYLEGDDAKVDGVMFAAIDSGDCFVFDVSAKGSDCPVFFYNHEENTLKAYAPNFAECIKRFVEKN